MEAIYRLLITIAAIPFKGMDFVPSFTTKVT